MSKLEVNTITLQMSFLTSERRKSNQGLSVGSIRKEGDDSSPSSFERCLTA